MSSDFYAAAMFPLLFIFIFLGFPVSFSLIATAFIAAWPVFGALSAFQVFGVVEHTASQFLLSAIPAFVFMGVMLEASGISERLFSAMQVWLHRFPGGLALTTMCMAGVIAASTGIVGAVEVVIGVMAIPVMLKNKYSKSLISGTICAGGSLGTMIPPSLVVVIYASISNQSVGKLFWAVLIPASLMVVLFLGYIIFRAIFFPADAPRAVNPPSTTLAQKLKITATGIFPAFTLIVAVLGSILWGVATPTEAASVGSAGAVILAICYRSLTWNVLKRTLISTLYINTMIMMIVLGGNIFSGIFRLHKGNELIQGLISTHDFSTFTIVGLMLLMVFLAGLVLDWVSIVLISLPIFLPILVAAEIDPIWFAALMVIVIQTSYLTPPMAPSIFYLRSIAPAEITYMDMYKGVVPFIICQILVLVLVLAWPELATYLPSRAQGIN